MCACVCLIIGIRTFQSELFTLCHLLVVGLTYFNVYVLDNEQIYKSLLLLTNGLDPFVICHTIMSIVMKHVLKYLRYKEVNPFFPSKQPSRQVM